MADGSGEITRHPYVYLQLNKLMARWAYKLLTGGGLSLPAFALADDGYLFLGGETVCHGADWLPAHKAITSVPSQYGLCARYPIRMFEDLLPMQHLHAAQVADELAIREGIDVEAARRIADDQLCLEGTYVLNSGTAKLNGGDFDFDLVCVIDGSQYPKFVAHRFNLASPQSITKEKANKARSAWWNLEFVALKARGNRIGAITDLKTRCYAAGRHDLAYRLVPELQREIDSLKWGVRADAKVLKEIREQVPMTPWLALKDVEAVSGLPLQLEVLRHRRDWPALQHAAQGHRGADGDAACHRRIQRPDHWKHHVKRDVRGSPAGQCDVCSGSRANQRTDQGQRRPPCQG